MAEDAAAIAAALSSFERAVTIACRRNYDAGERVPGTFELNAARGTRGYSFAPDDASFNEIYEHSEAVETTAEAVVQALELERGEESWTAKIRLGTASAPTYEIIKPEPDPELERYQAWRRHLQARLDSIAGGVDTSRGYGTIFGYKIGGSDPLDYISTLPRIDPPHWLYASNGFSEPSEPIDNGDTAANSGYGFEITLRIPRNPSDAGEAPTEYLGALQTMARYVFTTGNVFCHGDYTELTIPGLEALAGFAFIEDPELGEKLSPWGSITYLLAVGVDRRELEAIKLWNTVSFLDLAISQGKLTSRYLTVLPRASFMNDPAFAAAAREGGAREGSRTGHLFMPGLQVGTVSRLFRSPATVITFDADGAATGAMLLPNRIGFDRNVTIHTSSGTVQFQPAQRTSLSGPPNALVVGLTARDAAGIATAFANGAGKYEIGEAGLTLVFPNRIARP